MAKEMKKEKILIKMKNKYLKEKMRKFNGKKIKMAENQKKLLKLFNNDNISYSSCKFPFSK